MLSQFSILLHRIQGLQSSSHVLSSAMHKDADGIPLHSHLLGDFFIGAVLDAHQPERFGLLIGQARQLASDHFY
jgi:hypothetical protein